MMEIFTVFLFIESEALLVSHCHMLTTGNTLVECLLWFLCHSSGFVPLIWNNQIQKAVWTNQIVIWCYLIVVYPRKWKIQLCIDQTRRIRYQHIDQIRRTFCNCFVWMTKHQRSFFRQSEIRIQIRSNDKLWTVLVAYIVDSSLKKIGMVRCFI